MNDHDAQGILGLFLANYPQSSADEITIALWTRALAGVDFHDGQRAAFEWMTVSPYWPTIADITAILAAHKRRQHLVDSGRPQLTEGPVPSFEQGMQIAKRAYILECRSQGREPTPSYLAKFDAGELPDVGAA